MDPALRALIDREEIRETIMRWSRAVDNRDWNLLEQSYTDDLDSDFERLGLPKTGPKELRQMLELAGNKYFEFFQHILSNLTFHELTDRSARTSIMVSSYSKPIGGEMFQTNGWYHDELRRTPQGWRICKRVCEPIFNTAPNAGVAPVAADSSLPSR